MGELIITVDPKRMGSPFAMGSQTLLAGAAIPVHRHLEQDEVWFVHKGQGRATLEGKTATVVPGVTVYVPRQAWHGLRNTGTGLLQVTWVAVPPGIEEFFRELSRAGSGASEAARLQTIQEIAKRHGVEFRAEQETAGDADLPSSRRPRRRRPRHGRGQQPVPFQLNEPNRRAKSTPSVPAEPHGRSSAEIVGTARGVGAAPSPEPRPHSRGGVEAGSSFSKRDGRRRVWRTLIQEYARQGGSVSFG
jgi:quercetin dioxygenase-like cupin family protein